ncbi:hypothetical protein [Microbacterium invictum]|uniref:ABC transporter permease n=1 Tax=Microbacterium invictum TaxID=515415 RepID=A0ABZ0V9F7_9MICO|nr:hypothetical protein [Microbacterium invictum]WQB69879.1 hypothetical protein T9R20_14445 [Microbacterium invictum]
MTAPAIMRNVRAEWHRAWTVRSTVILVGLTGLGVIGLAALGASQSASTAPVGGSPWQLAGFLSLPALLGTLVLVSVLATADHSTGAIGPTLQWTPRRGILLLSRVVTIVVAATGIGVILLTASSAVVWLFAPQLTFFASDALSRIAGVAFVFAATSLLGVGTGLAVRNTAATLAVVFALVLVLPLLLQVVPFVWATRIIEGLPGAGVLFFLLGEGPGNTLMNTASAATTLLVWGTTALALGSVRLMRSDADR